MGEGEGGVGMACLPVGFRLVLVGAIPARPSAAKPANGFLVSPPICYKSGNAERRGGRADEARRGRRTWRWCVGYTGERERATKT